MAETRKTLVELLDDAYNKIESVAQAAEPALEDTELSEIGVALGNIKEVRDSLGELKKSVEEIINSCTTRI